MIPETPPVAGTVLRYNYLWRREADEGRDEGRKDRPVALLLSRAPGTGECVVVPITRRAPADATTAMALPPAEKVRLGLDDERSWIVLNEFNAFFWPGPDVRPVPNRHPSTIVYGSLSRGLYTRVLAGVQGLLRVGRVDNVPRT